MDFDLFDDIDGPPKNVRAGAKFQPKAKPRRGPAPKKSTPLVPEKVVISEEAEKQSNPDEQSNFGVVNPSAEEHGVSTCGPNSIVDSGPDIDVTHTEKSQDSGPNVDVPDTGKKQDSQALFERSTKEDGEDVMIDLESLDILNDSSSVFDNIFPSSETPAASNVRGDHVIQSIDGLHIPNVEIVEDPLIESEFIVMEPVHNRQDTIITDDEIPHLDAETPEEHIQTVSKAPRKLASRRAKRSAKDGKMAASDQSSNLHEGSTPSQTSKRGRVRKKRQNDDSSFRLVDEPEDDALVDERVGSDSEVQPTNKSPGEKKKQGRKRKGKKKTDEPEDDALVDERVGSDSEVQLTNKSSGEKEKPGRKRKKKDEAAAIKAPKKFSRSTKRRIVDKSLLENEEFERKKVSLTNLIRFAEYKERTSKKKNEVATASQAPPPNQATDNHSARFNGFGSGSEEDDCFGSGDDNVHGDPFNGAEENSKVFNYQTHMNKTARTKWTERDTELFYEGVQQFGTDFTMIQQLFPERTRRQVKLKYKNEERKYPLRIREAVMNRSQGHSHFDTVIERLKQKAAEEKENDEDDDDLLNGEEGAEEGDAGESEPRYEEAATTSAQVDHDQDVVDKEEVEEAAENQATEATVTDQADDSDDELKWEDYMCT